MNNDTVAGLFNMRSHNPSFFAVKENVGFRGELLDFCIPVNLHFPPDALIQSIHERLSEILRYYPDYADVHAEHIASLNNLDPNTIVPCNGSTEIITRLCQLATGPIVTSIPTFSRWTDLPEELHVPLHTILRLRERSFQLEVDEIVGRCRDVDARTLVISNPNNPTGAWLTLDQIKQLTFELDRLDAVIVDESFIDFSDLKSAASFASLAPNLIVVKSMGKSLGWHGVRLGYAVTNAELAKSLRAQLPFWNINGLAAYVLKDVTNYKDEFRASFSRVAEDRQYMFEQLSPITLLTLYPSKANFLFAELPPNISGRELRNRLLGNHGVLVRECGNKLGCSDRYLRIAVQRRQAVDVLVNSIKTELTLLAA
jgi:histidinol-phosphate/aromatic aminotransferase/cobyric acid decarboxylase-like protein